MKKLFLILIAFFSVSVFSQDPLIVNKENKPNIQKRGSPYRRCRLAYIRSRDWRRNAHWLSYILWESCNTVNRQKCYLMMMGIFCLFKSGRGLEKEGYLIEKVSKNSVTLQSYKAGQCEQNDLNHNEILK